MSEKEFDVLIDKYLNDELGSMEKNNIERWLHHITDQKAADFLTDVEKEESGIRIYSKLRSSIERTSTRKSSAMVRKLHPIFKIAASVLLFGILVFVCRNGLRDLFNIERYASVTNSSSHITKTILSDGSIVWLKGKSKLNYPVKFRGNLRTIDLEGEALFEIAKDPSHPFVIHCGGLTTRVLGTSFNIKSTGKKVEVNVLTGRVYLSSANSAPVILHPYQKALYLASKKAVVKQAEPVMEVASLIKGTEYNMLFNDARVEEVLQRVEKKFEVEITVKNQKLNNNLITADFTDQSLKNTISMMSEALNLDFEINGQAVVMAAKNN